MCGTALKWGALLSALPQRPRGRGPACFRKEGREGAGCPLTRTLGPPSACCAGPANWLGASVRVFWCASPTPGALARLSLSPERKTRWRFLRQDACSPPAPGPPEGSSFPPSTSSGRQLLGLRLPQGESSALCRPTPPARAGAGRSFPAIPTPVSRNLQSLPSWT